MGVKVLTLGDFDIVESGKSLMKSSSRANKRLELLKYFITYRDKKLTPQYIAENLWNDSASDDPKNALRTQVFRLRKMLDVMGLNSNGTDNNKNCLEITFQNGFYILNIGENCLVDETLFEGNIEAAERARSEDPNQAINKYKEAIQLYRGQYLADISDKEWVFTIRNRYHRLYVHLLIMLFELLKASGRNREIIEHFEQAVSYEPFEEALHIFLLEALLELKEYKHALSHYNYITGRMYRELSVKPSPALKGVYSRIVAGDKNTHEADLSTLSKSFTHADDMEGALFCDIEYFRTIYNLEERRSIRAQNKECLGLATINNENRKISQDKDNEAAETLKVVLRESLRRGDVFTQWNGHQMIVLLTDVHTNALDLISRRIRKRFNDKMGQEGFSVDISFKPISYDKKPFFA
ncbi:MAG: BTAD domain-containing putative transcriptional regulator [Firmicutes bacterium]|nr:BTAD domain-containing putative transcriptional regulator [Bacillota bacterium]